MSPILAKNNKLQIFLKTFAYWRFNDLLEASHNDLSVCNLQFASLENQAVSIPKQTEIFFPFHKQQLASPCKIITLSDSIKCGYANVGTLGISVNFR